MKLLRRRTALAIYLLVAMACLSSCSSGVFKQLSDIAKLRPLSRLGRNEWGDPPTVRAIDRISYDEWPGHYTRS